MVSEKTTGLDLQAIREYISNSSPYTKIFVGCDSEIKDNKRASFARVVVIWNHVSKDVSVGCKVFGDIVSQPFYGGVNNISQRLMQEVVFSAEIAEAIKDVVGDRVFEIHLDLSKNAIDRSNTIVSQATGYIRGLGFVPRIKPDAPAATSAADELHRILSPNRSGFPEPKVSKMPVGKRRR